MDNVNFNSPVIYWPIFTLSICALTLVYGNVQMWLFLLFTAVVLYLRMGEVYFKIVLFLTTILWHTFFGNHHDIFSSLSHTGLPSAKGLIEIFERFLGVCISIIFLFVTIKIMARIKILKNNNLIFGIIIIISVLEASRYIYIKNIAYSVCAFFSKGCFGFLYLLKDTQRKQSKVDTVFYVGLCSPVWSVFGRSLVIPKSPNSILLDRPKTFVELSQLRGEGAKIFFISTLTIIILDYLFIKIFKSPFSFFNWDPGLVSVIRFKAEYSFADLSFGRLWFTLAWVSTFSYVMIASSWNLVIGLANFMGINADLYWGNILKANSVTQMVTRTMRLNVNLIQDLFFMPIWSDLIFLKKYPKIRIFISIFISIFLADVCIHLFRDFNYLYINGFYETLQTSLELWGINFLFFAIGVSCFYLFDPIKKFKLANWGKLAMVALVLLSLGVLRVTDAPDVKTKIKILKNIFYVR